MQTIKEILVKHILLTTRFIYTSFILGFFIKSLGASWDASYHFKHFRDFLQLPHILNGIGQAIIIILFLYLWIIESKKQRSQLKIIACGLCIFIIGVFVDQWYHEKFGIDLTTWSPSHFILYIATLVTIIGAFVYTRRESIQNNISAKAKNILGLVFAYLALDNFWFPLLQQEQGVLMDYSLKHGIRLADPDLLDLFFRTQGDIYSGLPGWLYGVWAIFSMVLIFQFIKKVNFHKFGATIIAGLYLLERIASNNVFRAVDYPLSALPYYLIFIAFVFDLVYNNTKKESLRAVLTTLVPVLGIILVGLINPTFPIHPPIPLMSTFLVGVPVAILTHIIAKQLSRLAI